MNLKISLPWPPSANKYWRYWRGRVLVSKDARQYKKDIEQLSYTWATRRLYGKLSIDILVNPPDKRKRDLDNLLKVTLDSLEATGLFDDDYQINKITIERGIPIQHGNLKIELEQID